MQGFASQKGVSPRPGDRLARLHRLQEVVRHASHVLPAQGPITVFIHHNTLHAFEDLPFYEAVKKGAQIFGCHPYMSEDRYRDALARGRIRFSELQEVLEHDLGGRAGEEIPCFGNRLGLFLAMLQYPLRSGPTEELVWYVAEVNALRRVRSEVSSAVRARLIAETRRWVIRDLRGGNEGAPNGSAESPVSASLTEMLRRFGASRIESWSDDDWEGFTLQALWRLCCDGVRDLPPYTKQPQPPVRQRDILFEATGVDTDALVHDVLIRFCAAFLDQGMAKWQLPRRSEGLYRAFCSLYRHPGRAPADWMRELAQELGRLEDQATGPLDSILESLDALGVSEEEWERFLSATLLALRGWGGMIHQVELHGDRVVQPIPEGSLVGFLAIRLLLDRFALAYTARSALGLSAPVREFWRLARGKDDPHWPPSVEQRAFLVFQLAQVLGLSPDVVYRLSKPEWATLLQEIESFTAIERRRIFHLAYERRFSTQTLDAITLHVCRPAGRPESPRFQAVFCLDEREESFRRHLEELAPNVETFGVAGFYAVAIYYKGAADAHFTPLCPVLIRPEIWVIEEVETALGESNRRRAQTRRVLGTVSLRIHEGSRGFALGAILTGALGVLASFPLLARILFPRLTARIRHRFGRLVETPPLTRLRVERTQPSPGPADAAIGFSIVEMVNAAERLLRDIGLTRGFARLLLLHGHGSHSQNNPHDSAHNCGACGGGLGGPNARTMAQLLNDPRVRDGMRERGLSLPDDTVVVGGYHNTCDDSVTYYDLDRIPASHRHEFETARAEIELTCERNAHERCRRFYSAPLTLSFTAAREHVEARAEDLAQVRPEFGHCTNAITIVGRREWSRGLFLDRRAFLASYDPTEDDADHTILTRILQAVFPVCAGINLEYYFSNVDNVGFGCGTKLPHNLTSLLGVMDGAASDLRTGLPWQMVEIHEPVRSQFVIETTPVAMQRIMDGNQGIGRLCRNGWVLLAVIDPTTRVLSVFEDGAFRPYQPQASMLPKAASSVDWYRGWRDHLEFAQIER
jgi:uncharacterized protein YbcC (UPF0753/DUF2309 family)